MFGSERSGQTATTVKYLYRKHQRWVDAAQLSVVTGEAGTCDRSSDGAAENNLFDSVLSRPGGVEHYLIMPPELFKKSKRHVEVRCRVRG